MINSKTFCVPVRPGCILAPTDPPSPPGSGLTLSQRFPSVEAPVVNFCSEQPLVRHKLVSCVTVRRRRFIMDQTWCYKANTAAVGLGPGSCVSVRSCNQPLMDPPLSFGSSPAPGPQHGVLMWISSALPQPAVSPKLSRANATTRVRIRF